MVHADPYSIKPLKEVDQDPGCSDCMKRCDSVKIFWPYIIFQMFCNKKKLKLGDISHAPHHIWYI